MKEYRKSIGSCGECPYYSMRWGKFCNKLGIYLYESLSVDFNEDTTIHPDCPLPDQQPDMNTLMKSYERNNN